MKYWTGEVKTGVMIKLMKGMGVKVASENKKRKAKNSYLTNGGEKLDGKFKRIMYFTKRQRNKNKQALKQMGE